MRKLITLAAIVAAAITLSLPAYAGERGGHGGGHGQQGGNFNKNFNFNKNINNNWNFNKQHQNQQQSQSQSLQNNISVIANAASAAGCMYCGLAFGALQLIAGLGQQQQVAVVPGPTVYRRQGVVQDRFGVVHYHNDHYYITVYNGKPCDDPCVPKASALPESRQYGALPGKPVGDRVSWLGTVPYDLAMIPSDARAVMAVNPRTEPVPTPKPIVALSVGPRGSDDFIDLVAEPVAIVTPALPYDEFGGVDDAIARAKMGKPIVADPIVVFDEFARVDKAVKEFAKVLAADNRANQPKLALVR